MQQSNPQSNALRRLEDILDEAVAYENKAEQTGVVLLKVMKLDVEPQNIVEFYELLSKAKEESLRINKPKISRYISTLDELHKVFILNHLWTTEWNILSHHIESRNVLNTLDALADFFHAQDPLVFLEQDFLDKLKTEFQSLSDSIINSSLSNELKRFLTEKIEDILTAIRRYHIDGTEGLKKAAQSLVSDLVMTEYKIKDADKKNPVYNKAKGWFLGILLLLVPTSPYDIIGAAPDIYGFWIPKFEELVAGQKKIEQIACETPTIQGVLEKSADVFDRQPQKNITGSAELKALPASKEEDSTKDIDNP
jgi:hypothetical protein